MSNYVLPIMLFFLAVWIGLPHLHSNRPVFTETDKAMACERAFGKYRPAGEISLCFIDLSQYNPSCRKADKQ